MQTFFLHICNKKSCSEKHFNEEQGNWWIGMEISQLITPTPNHNSHKYLLLEPIQSIPTNVGYCRLIREDWESFCDQITA